MGRDDSLVSELTEFARWLAAKADERNGSGAESVGLMGCDEWGNAEDLHPGDIESLVKEFVIIGDVE